MQTLLWTIPISVLIGIGFYFLIRQLIVRPLGAVVSSIEGISSQASSSAAEFSDSSQSLAEGASEQAASLEELSSMTKRNAENAHKANGLARQARAGEAGMGFAVVADEVRNLAQRSARTARETADKIEGAIGNSTQGVELSRKVAETLNENGVKDALEVGGWAAAFGQNQFANGPLRVVETGTVLGDFHRLDGASQK